MTPLKFWINRWIYNWPELVGCSYPFRLRVNSIEWNRDNPTSVLPYGDIDTDPEALKYDPNYTVRYRRRVCVLTGRSFGLIITRERVK